MYVEMTHVLESCQNKNAQFAKIICFDFPKNSYSLKFFSFINSRLVVMNLD